MIRFVYPEDNIERSWPKGKDMAQFFATTMAEFVLQSRLNSFFLPLQAEMTKLKSELQYIMQNYMSSINQLYAQLSDFQEETQVNGKFVM